MSMSAEPLTEVGAAAVDIHVTAAPTRPPPPTKSAKKVDDVKRLSVSSIHQERGVDVGTRGQPFVPTLLRNRKFQWDKIRQILDRAEESADKDLHDQLPPQETPWMNESSPVEQLRMFLSLNP